VSAILKTDIASSTTQVVSGAITGDMKLNYKDMLRSAALAGALSVVTTSIDTQMGYNKIDPSTGKQVVLSYGDKVSREMLHGLATKAVYGGDIETIMASSAGNVAFDYIAHDVYAKNPDFPVPKTLTHALIGGTLSELAGGDFSQGAISTAVAHVVADALVNQAMSDIDSGKVTIENNPEAINAYIKNLKVQVEAVSSAVAGAVTLATHENVTDEELAISQNMAKSVVEYNSIAKIVVTMNKFDGKTNLGTAKVYLDGEKNPRSILITSGKNTSDSTQKDAGPTPEGTYIIDPNKSQNMSLIDRLLGVNQGNNELSTLNLIRKNTPSFIGLGGGDWGDFRAPLEPINTTNTFNRTNMYLHGGSFPGSVGCIDCGSTYDSWLLNELRDTNHIIPVEVKYGK
jgi:hypothetical protein